MNKKVEFNSPPVDIPWDQIASKIDLNLTRDQLFFFKEEDKYSLARPKISVYE